MMINQIGDSAGVVWEYLSDSGEITMTKLQEGTKLNKATMDMAIGWLAREGKVKIEGKRTKKICLSE